MTDFKALPPEDRLPEETPAPAPAVFPPPEEGAAGTAEVDRRGRARGRTAARQRSKSALLLAVAGAALCTVIYAAPVKPADLAPPAETAAAEPIAQTEATQPPVTQPVPAETEPAAPNAAQRLVAVGTWKNDAAGEWVHFNADGTGWWYDGTYFGWMNWAEDEDGGVRYEAAMAYLGPGQMHSDAEHAPEKSGDCLQTAESSGSIELLPDEDRFTCPGLRFGDGTYLPDDTRIDASVMDRVLGKTAAELVSGTSWRMVETSDLGIPVAPSAGGGKDGLYTDMVYVQSIDFAASTFVITTRDGGLLEEYHAVDGSFQKGEPSRTFAISFSLSAEEKETVAARLKLYLSARFRYFSDYRPGDTEYNNMHLLWGRSYANSFEYVYLLLTDSGIRLGMNKIDLYSDNYTLLARD